MDNEKYEDELQFIEEEPEFEKEPYIGSVRFYKNIILLIVIVLIAVPVITSLRYRNKLYNVGGELAAVQHQLTTLQRANQKTQQERLKVMHENSANVADTPYYQELYPDFYAPQDYMASKRRENMIFLTFDDGPTKRTDEILDILSQRDIKATFFVVHHNDTGTEERLKRIVNEGHSIGMHSYIHDYGKVYESVETFLEDMYKIFVEITKNLFKRYHAFTYCDLQLRSRECCVNFVR